MDWFYLVCAVLLGGFFYIYKEHPLSSGLASAAGFFLMLLGGVTVMQYEAYPAGALLFMMGGVVWIAMAIMFIVDFTLWRERKQKAAKTSK